VSAPTWTQTVSAEFRAEAARLRAEAPKDMMGTGRLSPGETLAASLDRIADGFGKYVVSSDGQASEGSA
jgi:hypothetical protein